MMNCRILVSNTWKQRDYMDRAYHVEKLFKRLYKNTTWCAKNVIRNIETSICIESKHIVSESRLQRIGDKQALTVTQPKLEARGIQAFIFRQ